jgi:predicted O-methyltransferase YrrM
LVRPAIGFIQKHFGDTQIIGAEVGVFRGRHAAQILQRVPNVEHLYLIDPYEIYEGYDDANMHLVPRAKAFAARLFEKGNIDQSRYTWIYAKFSANLIPEPLDFIYIDGSHQYEHVSYDIVEAEKIVMPGGVISGHDYYPEDDVKRVDLHGVGQAVRDHYGVDFEWGGKDWWTVKE